MGFDELSRLTKDRSVGPRPFFSQVHVIRLLELVAVRYYSRKELVKQLGVGEGSVRTMINILRTEGLVDVRRAGVRISPLGSRLLDSLRGSFSAGVRVPACRSMVDAFNVAILVREPAVDVASGIRQRDAAMMVGATGASTFTKSSGRLIFPGMHQDLGQYDPELSRAVLDSLEPADGDVVVIGSARDLARAHLGAIAAALTLL